MANPYRSNDANASRFILSQTITVRSNNVDLVEKSLPQTDSLIAKGIIFDSASYEYPVSYIFTKLNNITLLASDDISKIILICDDGKYLYDRLLKEYNVQLEMASFKYAIAMTSVADKQEYYDRFLSALKEIDESRKVDSKDSENDVVESLGNEINNKTEV